MPKRTLYPIQHYGSELKESRKSYEPDKVWGDRKPFNGNEKAWEPRVDSVFIECVQTTEWTRKAVRS
jgi:hypothetical protein